MPSLRQLEGEFTRFSIEPAGKHIGQPQPDGSIQWGGFPQATWTPVKTRAEADAVWFLCPLCFRKNGGNKGTHWVRVDFHGSRTPDEHVIHNSQGLPVRWHATGDSLDTLSLTPSIQLNGGCGWHGYVTNGSAD